MGKENIEEMVDSALLKGIIESECMQCGTSLQCEPSASRAWCDNCQKLVLVTNDLIRHGFI